MEMNRGETDDDGNRPNGATEENLPIGKPTRDQKAEKEEFVDTEQAKIVRRRNRIKAAMLIASSSQWFEDEAQTRDIECPDDIDAKEWAITWAHLAELKRLDFRSLYRGLTNGMPKAKVAQVTSSMTTASYHGGVRYHPLDVTGRIGHKPASVTCTALRSNHVEKRVTQSGIVSDTGIGRLPRQENSHTSSMDVEHKSPLMSGDTAATKKEDSVLRVKNDNEDDFSEDEDEIFRNLRVTVSDSSSEWENIIPEPVKIDEENDIFPARRGSSANVLNLAYTLDDDVVIPKQAPRRLNNRVAPLFTSVCDQSRRLRKSGYIAPDYSMFTASGFIAGKKTSRAKETQLPRSIGKCVNPRVRKDKLERKRRDSESSSEVHTVQVTKGGSFSRLLRRIRSFSCFGRNSVVAPM